MVFGKLGEVVAGEALYYGPNISHNEAEAMACRALHECLVRLV